MGASGKKAPPKTITAIRANCQELSNKPLQAVSASVLNLKTISPDLHLSKKAVGNVYNFLYKVIFKEL